MEEILKLAMLLDQFVCAYDPYEYADCVEDPMQNIAEITEMIRDGRTGGITEWLQVITDNSDEETCNIETAKKLLQSIEEERRKNYESTYGRAT